MLIYRVITAIILIPIVLIGLFLLPMTGFSLFVALILLIASWEWSRLMGLTHLGLRCLYVICIGIFLILSYLWSAWQYQVMIGTAWWCIATILVSLHKHFRHLFTWHRLVKAIMGIVILIPCFAGFLCIREHSHGRAYILLALIIVWAMDTGAYFAGKIWGKHKLAETISPKKTVEGLFGGLVVAIVVTAIFCWLTHVSPLLWPKFIGLAIICALISVIGDLYESMLKRQVGIKDSGRILPGHGGLLDRIDSLTAAIPVFALGLWMIAL